MVILQVFLTFTAATVILRGNFTKDSKTAHFLKMRISPAFSLSRQAPRLSPDSPRFSPTLPDSPPTLLSWFPFAVECEVAFPRLSPTLPRLSPTLLRLSLTLFSNLAVGLREIIVLGVFARISMISKNFHELLKLLAFSFCVCEGFGVCCRGVLESRVKALATADRHCVVSLFG